MKSGGGVDEDLHDARYGRRHCADECPERNCAEALVGSVALDVFDFV